MIKRDYTIKSVNGLTSRLSSALVSMANRFKCDSQLIYLDESADLKSIMNVMSLVIRFNEPFSILTTGDDELTAINSIESLMKEIHLI